ALITTIHRPQLVYRLALTILWGVALLLCVFLVRANLTFTSRKEEVRRSRFDPRDDLFTEHYIREATSFLDPIPQKVQVPDKQPPAPPPPEGRFPARVFRDYDIRGLAGSEIDEHFAATLGRVLGSLALE